MLFHFKYLIIIKTRDFFFNPVTIICRYIKNKKVPTDKGQPPFIQIIKLHYIIEFVKYRSQFMQSAL